MTRTIPDPDDPGYADDGIGPDNEADACHHGVPFDEDCDECEIKYLEDLDEDEPEAGDA